MSTSSQSAPTHRVLHYALWGAQLLLAAPFLMAGAMKLATPPADLVAAGMAWAGRLPGPLVPFIGLSELLGALGLVLPAALRIAPALTPLAAAGLATIMLLAAGEHAMAGELSVLPVNAVLGGIAAFIAWGRWGGAPIPGR